MSRLGKGLQPQATRHVGIARQQSVIRITALNLQQPPGSPMRVSLQRKPDPAGAGMPVEGQAGYHSPWPLVLPAFLHLAVGPGEKLLSGTAWVHACPALLKLLQLPGDLVGQRDLRLGGPWSQFAQNSPGLRPW